MEEIAEFRLRVQQPALAQEGLERGPGKRSVRDRRGIVRVEIRSVLLQRTDRVVVASPQIVLRSQGRPALDLQP